MGLPELTREEIVRCCLKSEAYREVQNALGRYIYNLTSCQWRACADQFALESEGTWAEMVWGRYDGKEGIERLYCVMHRDTCTYPGFLAIHSLCTPVIEIADDCQTAKAVFLSPGVETSPEEGETRGPHCDWCWIKYDAEFIKEKTGWKIWHLRTIGIFECDYYKSWMDTKPENPNTDPNSLKAEWFADGPTVRLDMRYTPQYISPLDPPMPQPYAAYDGFERFGIKVNNSDYSIIERPWDQTIKNYEEIYTKETLNGAGIKED